MTHFGGSFFDFVTTTLYTVNMITFTHIEDYLEVLGGYREITAKGLSPLHIFGINTPVINLARYDVAIVQSMASHTSISGSLTDRQSELAVKLVAKYQRQFASRGVDVVPSVQNPQFRLQPRVIDRSKSVDLVSGELHVKFPYDKVLVPGVTAAAKQSKGRFVFDRELKVWRLGLTESNVNWAVGFGTEHGFTVSEEVQRLMQLILDCEQTDYRIELVTVNGDLTITNAEWSLYKYIDDHLGGLGIHNLIQLIDYAPVLGYTVHADITAAIETEFDPIVCGVMQNKESHVMRQDPLDHGQDLLESMAQYAELVNRWPICIYEPDASNRLRDTATRLFAQSEILDTTDKKVAIPLDLVGIKCVYFNKLKRSWKHRIPILISTNAMLHGSEKQATLQVAEKVVYYTATTYDKEAKTIAGKTNN